MTAMSIILTAYHVLNHSNINQQYCPDSHCMTSVRFSNFSNQTINTRHRPSLVRKLFY